MRRAVVLGRIISNRHIARRKRHVLARHHECGGFHLPGHAVRVGGVREHIRAVARHAPRAFALARQPFCQRHALLRKRDSRPITAIPQARIRQLFIARRWADTVVLDREPERLCHRRHRRGGASGRTEPDECVEQGDTSRTHRPHCRFHSFHHAASLLKPESFPIMPVVWNAPSSIP